MQKSRLRRFAFIAPWDAHGASRAPHPFGYWNLGIRSRAAVPVAGRSWAKALPDARWRAGIRGTKGARNRNYKHGGYTADAMASRRWVREKIRDQRWHETYKELSGEKGI